MARKNILGNIERGNEPGFAIQVIVHSIITAMASVQYEFIIIFINLTIYCQFVK